LFYAVFRFTGKFPASVPVIMEDKMKIQIKDRNWEVFVEDYAIFLVHGETGNIYLFFETKKIPELSNFNWDYSYYGEDNGRERSTVRMQAFKENF